MGRIWCDGERLERRFDFHHITPYFSRLTVLVSRFFQKGDPFIGASLRGAAPQLKSDEFLDLPLLLNELGSVLSVKPPKKVKHILGARLT